MSGDRPRPGADAANAGAAPVDATAGGAAGGAAGRGERAPAPAPVTIRPLLGMPEIETGDDIGAEVVTALRGQGVALQDGDILVVTSKIVSKAEGLSVPEEDRAGLVLRESRHVVTERRTSAGVTRVVAAKAGPVMAGAGIDASNAGEHDLLLLPHDPDASARHVRDHLRAAGAPHRVGVVLSDTAGRPWRTGLTDLALGLAGIVGMEDLRGRDDDAGRPMAVTVRCLADELAAAADLVKGKLDRVPVALVRGLGRLVVAGDGSSAQAIVRSGPEDWFGLGRAEAVRDALGVPAGSRLSESCGIESVEPEPRIAAVSRAVRVALADDQMAGVGASSADGSTIELSCDEPLLLGRAWARVEVALAGERLRAETAGPVGPGTRIELRVEPR